MYHIRYAKGVSKDLDRIDRKQLQRIRKAIEFLKDFPDIPNMKKLNAHPLADYRLRIGDYRVLFDVEWDSRIIYILKIGHRKDIY